MYVRSYLYCCSQRLIWKYLTSHHSKVYSMKIQITTQYGGKSEIIDFDEFRKGNDFEVLLKYFNSLTINVVKQ